MYSRFLSELLVANRLSGRGKYYAREVSIDYGTSKVKRIDFMQFEPAGVIYQGDIEKGYSHVMKSRVVEKMYTAEMD